MEKLWAPWRMEYINELKSGKDDGCFMCHVAADGDDEKNLVLARGKHVYVIMNRFPYNCGHLMVIPNTHCGDISKLSNDEMAEIMEATGVAIDVMKEAIDAEGFNCGFNLGRLAGAGVVDHVHMHIVPRWVGDSNFFPIIGNTKSLPECLEDTYKRLKPAFKKWEGGK